MTGKHEKSRAFLRGWLVSRQMFRAVEALEWMESLSTGTRKDGVTPESNHPLSVALYLVSLSESLMYVEETVITALIHDLAEDYNIDLAEVERRFGRRVRDALHALTKVFGTSGIKRDPHEVAHAQGSDPIASVVKGSDRLHNQSTSIGVFNAAKMVEYVNETNTFILPMLRNARKNFPEQYGVYMNLKTVIEGQCDFMSALAGIQG